MLSKTLKYSYKLSILKGSKIYTIL